MTGNEIFSRLTPEEAHAIFEDIYVFDKAMYRACMQLTAQRKKLRPVFVEKKSRPDRHAWMQNVLTSKSNDDAAVEILQNWLLGCKKDMLAAFLDQCEIAHEDAILEDIPAQPDEKKLSLAIETIFANFEAPAPKIYLMLFQPLGNEAWPILDEFLESDPRVAAPSVTVP